MDMVSTAGKVSTIEGEEEMANRLEQDISKLLDNDEDNDYLPTRNTRGTNRPKIGSSSDVGAEGPHIVKESFLTKSNTDNKSENLENFKGQNPTNFEVCCDDEDKISKDNFKICQDNLSDDATLEEIFRSENSLYKTSGRKSIVSSFRASMGNRNSLGVVNETSSTQNRYSIGQNLVKNRQENLEQFLNYELRNSVGHRNMGEGRGNVDPSHDFDD